MAEKKKLNQKQIIRDLAELLEETGFASEEWEDFGRLDPFTTIFNAPNHMFLARNVRKIAEPKPDGGEILKMIMIPFSEALGKVLRSEITHAASCVLILRTHLFLSGG